MKNLSFVIILAISTAIINLGIYIILNQKIVSTADYEQFLNAEHLDISKEKLNAQISFWEQKLGSAPKNFVYQKKLAGLYAANFKLTGNIQFLASSDSILEEINVRIPNQVGVLQSLSANAITRHDFPAAEKYAEEAVQIGERKFVSSLLKADALLERGNFWEAKTIIGDIVSVEHFDFLIRNVKLLDQMGNLEAAIENMEQALALARASGNPELINWSLSNLGDMYGHDGQISKSYRTFLEALSYNPADLHSLKGIAWIAFAKDKNTETAKRIISFLKSIHPIPDYNLLLAEIANYEGKEDLAEKLENEFIEVVSRPEYGKMYHSYACLLKKDKAEILKIAQSEIENRPHPTSYNLLAWASFQNGEKQKAVEILEKYVIGRTGEPDVVYYAGIIMKEAGHNKQAKSLLKEALDASFELGPVATTEIKKHLATL